VLHWNQVHISSVFEIFGFKYIGVTNLTFCGHVTSLSCDHLLPLLAFTVGSIVIDSLPLADYEILGPKHIGVTTLTFQGHVTSPITWRFDSPFGVSCRCSIGTKPLSPSVFEIFGSKYIGVTNLSFWGHVMSLSCDHLLPHIAFTIGSIVSQRPASTNQPKWHPPGSN